MLQRLRVRLHAARRHQLATGILGALAVATLVWMGISAWSQDTGGDNVEASFDFQTAQSAVPTYGDLSRELAHREREGYRAEQVSQDLQQALAQSQENLDAVVREREAMRAALDDARDQITALVAMSQQSDVSAERVALLEQELDQLKALTNLQHKLYGQLASRYQDLLKDEAETLSFAVETLEVAEAITPVWGMIELFADEGLGLLQYADATSRDLSIGSTDVDGGRVVGGGAQAGDAESDAIEVALLLDQTLADLEQFRLLRARTPLGSPVPNGRISSHYGLRLNPVTGQYSAHRGIDLAAPRGTPVLVQAPGEVTFAGWRGSFGRFVEIEHADGVITRYAHLNKISVATGDRVEGGDAIAQVGSSGRSTGPHLHYEILVDNDWVDPHEWIKAKDDVFTQ